MVAKVFIDGAAGTTGLEIRERLAGRGEFSLMQLSDAERRDVRARTSALNEADVVILCLPDEAAREAVALIENPAVRVIDASSAHRVAPGWVFGFPEFEPGNYEKIATAERVTNPGCYSTGFLALVRPLVRAGVIPCFLASHLRLLANVRILSSFCVTNVSSTASLYDLRMMSERTRGLR